MLRYFKYLDENGAKPTLTNRTLRWSRPSRFNDIYDMAQPYSTDLDSGFVMERALDLMWERLSNPKTHATGNQMGAMLDVFRSRFLSMGPHQFREQMRPGVEAALESYSQRMDAFGTEIVEHLQRVKVLCLSSTHDNNALWGLYANHHRGLVLEFANVAGLDSVYKCARPVTYSDKPPPMLGDEDIAQLLAGNIELSTKLVDPLMYLKSTHWSYEQELRIVSGEGRNRDSEFEDIWFHPAELVGVYFGARSQELRAELEPFVISHYPHAQRWQAVIGREFRIEFERLDTADLGRGTVR